MKKSTAFTILSLLGLIALGQTIDLTFTAIDNESYIKLDSIKVMNRTQVGDTVLYWPDTVLTLNFVGENEISNEDNAFRIFQNYPNPVVDHTAVTMYIPKKDKVSIFVTDILGRIMIQTEPVLDMGKHTFLFTPESKGLCLLTAQWQGFSKSIKILTAGSSASETARIEYISTESNYQRLKALKDVLGFPFNPGDQLLYICYYNNRESGIYDNPLESQLYTCQFATNIPCPGLPTVEYGGHVYNTIQVCSQCWLKENLDIGLMISAPNPQTNNDTIEKYCMGNLTYFCDIAGGLYFWNEMMDYTAQSGARGICPEGWHIPGDLDWQILEGTTDSIFGIGDPIWNNTEWRGIDAGGNLKKTGYEYWEPPNTGATDAFGFTALPGGYYVQNDFWGPGYKGIFWSSDPNNKMIRNMDWNEARVRRVSGSNSGLAVSVRCVKD
ncbi:MAG TPA: fibrobacter succinogenes major paralogous domain-containing protein [Bacteroidales bacterium]|nr:fibrobacter succinogenes major paralogous domain-containing protein [Bacteroidales bacterium]